METTELILRQFLEHPHRKRFVFILTCLVAAIGVWPVAERYFDLCDYEETLVLELEEAIVQAEGVEALERIAAKCSNNLIEWESRIVSEDQTYQFRNSLVALARTSGCRVRRVDVGPSMKTKWNNDDFIMENPAAAKTAKKSNYHLRKQSVVVTVAGELPQILAFLEVLDNKNLIEHHQAFSLKLASRGRSEVVLDIELVLMEPTTKKAA